MQGKLSFVAGLRQQQKLGWQRHAASVKYITVFVSTQVMPLLEEMSHWIVNVMFVIVHGECRGDNSLVRRV